MVLKLDLLKLLRFLKIVHINILKYCFRAGAAFSQQLLTYDVFNWKKYKQFIKKIRKLKSWRMNNPDKSKNTKNKILMKSFALSIQDTRYSYWKVCDKDIFWNILNEISDFLMQIGLFWFIFKGFLRAVLS